MEKGSFRKKISKIIIGITVATLVIYGAGRLYFGVTGGFTIGNITSDFKPDPRWDTRPLTQDEQLLVGQILTQPFRYLGKGCQSYVFASDDGQYVVKFFKYQRYRHKPWLDYLTFIGPVAEIREKSIEKKRERLDSLYTSWKIGFDHLQKETGLVYVHLNKTNTLNQNITIFDKMGFEHTLEADQMEFLIQKRAEMLCSTIDRLMAKGEEKQAKELLTNLVNIIVEEYKRGFADNDHALMQNTGVYQGIPIHVDVGQFVYDVKMQNPDVANQEIFNKMFRLRKWLQQEHPTLIGHLDKELVGAMGEKFYELKYIPKPRHE